MSAHQALIGLYQQIAPLKAAHRDEATFDHNVVVGKTGQRRCHENAIANDSRVAETGAPLHSDKIAIGQAQLGSARPVARIDILSANCRLDPEIWIEVESVVEVSDDATV